MKKFLVIWVIIGILYLIILMPAILTFLGIVGIIEFKN